MLFFKVKSVIVVPLGPLTQQNAEPTNQPPKQISLNCKDKHVSARSCRPVIFDCESELMRDKGMYIYSVTRHMNENRGLNQGFGRGNTESTFVCVEDAITELHHLMDRVSDPSCVSAPWQHSSDLTHRNYQRRFGNLKPAHTLSEWKAKNCATHKRFAKALTEETT
ncbi:S100P-binding protein-like isoform X3 [Antennarius striatus]|uniref:S100P-binding protein-like isoform X3 n=1 Tax=Antennarius striatus TaxID=241820 RepID=UPI0035B366EB